MKTQLLTIFTLLTLNLFATASTPPQMLGGGNLYPGNLEQAERRLQTLHELNLGMCRIPLSPGDYKNQAQDNFDFNNLDKLILLAHHYQVTPMLLFEYYTRWGDELGSYEDWKSFGSAFAHRYGPGSDWLQSQNIQDWGVEFYTAINEPMWDDNNPTPIEPKAYAAALEGLADGVHSVNSALKVCPGGYQEIPLLKRNNYGPAIAHLFNEGKLYAIDIHRYYDVDYQPMAETYNNSLQNQFDQVKDKWGIIKDIKFFTTEFNFKKREITEEQAAKGFLTAIWDALGVVGNEGQHVTQFALPWNIFHLETDDEHYGLCTDQSPWLPNARGKVLQMIGDLTKDLHFTKLDPKQSGEFHLESEQSKLIVWQNRTGWTDHFGDRFMINDIPTWTKFVYVYGWDGLRRAVPVNDRDEVEIKNLQTEETLMFLIMNR